MKSHLEMLLAIPFLISLFFWLRGLLKGSKSDLVLGSLLLLLTTFLAIYVVGHSGVFSPIGGVLLLFGIASLLMQKNAAEKKMMSKNGVIFIGVLLIIIGILMSSIV